MNLGRGVCEGGFIYTICDSVQLRPSRASGVRGKMWPIQEEDVLIDLLRAAVKAGQELVHI